MKPPPITQRRKPSKRQAEPPENRAETGRDAEGKFRPGTSGNPGGRPRLRKEFRDACRADSYEALETLRAEMRRGDTSAARIRAAEVVLAYAYGRPTPAGAEDEAQERPPALAKLSNEKLNAILDELSEEFGPGAARGNSADDA